MNSSTLKSKSKTLETRDPDTIDVSLPSYLSFGPSKIPNAGNGIFTNCFLPSGFDLGCYKGKWVTPEDFAELPETSLYIWEVKDYRGNKKRPRGVRLKDNTTIGYLDGENPQESSFHRYINHPCNAAQENLQAVQSGADIRYLTKRDVEPGEELYVYYGPEYSKYLLGTDALEI